MSDNLTYLWIQFCLVDETLDNMVDALRSHSGTIYEFRSFLRVKDIIDDTLEARPFIILAIIFVLDLGFHQSC